MKWLRRLLLLLLFVSIFVGTAGIAAWRLSRRPPQWYTRRHVKPEEAAAAAQRAQRQVLRTLSWAQDQQAYVASSRVGPPSTQPDKSLQISFTEDELNGFFQDWDATFRWTDRYRDYMSDPQIVLEEGRLILAADVKQMGTVLSVEFDPRLEDGKLHMPVERVLAGRLPLPQSFWSGYRVGLESAMKKSLPAWQHGAEIRPDGTANPDAVKAAMTELLMDVLNQRLGRAVLFLPYDVSNGRRSLPVKLTGMEIAGKALVLTLQPLSAEERRVLLISIQTPQETQRLAPADTGSAQE
jgi:uncharacterized protein YpmS